MQCAQWTAWTPEGRESLDLREEGRPLPLPLIKLGPDSSSSSLLPPSCRTNMNLNKLSREGDHCHCHFISCLRLDQTHHRHCHHRGTGPIWILTKEETKGSGPTFFSSHIFRLLQIQILHPNSYFLSVAYFRSSGLKSKVGCCGEDGGQSGGNGHWFPLLPNLANLFINKIL